MFERMFRPCGVMINAGWVHTGSSGMPKEPETPQAGDAPTGHCLAALCPGKGGKPGKLPTSCQVGGESQAQLWELWLRTGLWLRVSEG